MNLEILKNRVKEIEAAMLNFANQHQALAGHKAEVEYWIAELVKAAPVVENVIEEVVNAIEAPVV